MHLLPLCRRRLRCSTLSGKSSGLAGSVKNSRRMLRQIDFLSQPSPQRLRRELSNICDSYSHPWDVVAELTQNAVDAIRLHIYRYGSALLHKIGITIDQTSRSISVSDTGIGIGRLEAPELLSPHSSNKDPDDSKVIGQKGVGLTYVIFMSETFKLDTRSETGRFVGEIEGAARWRSGSDGAPPQLNIIMDESDIASEGDFGTRITASGIHAQIEEIDFFSASIESVVRTLRTKTAIGWTGGMFGKDVPPIEVSLNYRDQDGKERMMSVPFKYYFPEESLTTNRFVDLNEFLESAALWSDKQKVKFLSGKCVRQAGSTKVGNKTVSYYAFFPPSRTLWDEMNGSLADNAQAPYRFSPGIFIGSRGMPSGVPTRSPPATGAAGYWSRFFLYLEDDSLRFDLGRKSVPGRTQGVLKEIARSIFNRFVGVANYLSTDPPVNAEVAPLLALAKQQEFSDMRELANIDCNSIAYRKHPDSQEAAVVAIFHELLGAKQILGYRPLKTGYKMSYDLWALYEASDVTIGKAIRGGSTPIGEIPVVIEFKFKGEQLLSDPEENKYFQDIDIICCWDFDQAKLGPNVSVKPISKDDRYFHSANYEFEWAAAFNLGAAGRKQVISLRQLLDELRS